MHLHSPFNVTAYLFSSSALFFKSSLVSFVGRLSAWTGPCLGVSFHQRPSNHPGDVRTGFALCALAWALPPEVAASAFLSSLGYEVSVCVLELWGTKTYWSGCELALLSDDSLATLSVMPGGVSLVDVVLRNRES